MQQATLITALLGASCGGGGVTPAGLAGSDWSLPDYVQPTGNSGLFSEEADPGHHVDTHSVDLSWRQIEPAPGMISTTTTGSANGFTFASLDDQLAIPGQYWMRIFASGVDWAPDWVIADCGVAAVGTDADGEPHLPIWNACLWGHLRDLYTALYATRGMAADPDLRFVYVPGGFDFVEFDLDIVQQAFDAGLVTEPEFTGWFHGAIGDLVTIFGEHADKLVYTGEDYPFGPFGAGDDLLARDAVVAGMGIRNGITELANFHLNEVPAFGATIGPDGHLVTDESWLLLDGRHVIAAENECYDACGFHSADPEYSVTRSNLKALQLRVNWLYVVGADSFLDEFVDHWHWVRLSIGKTVSDSADAWCALREAEDKYWEDDPSITWTGHPFVRNLERWLVQKEVAPDGLTRRGSDRRVNDLDPANGTAFEGRVTHRAAGADSMYFDLDDRFLGPGSAVRRVAVNVTYLDAGDTGWSLEYAGAGGARQTDEVTNSGGGTVRTATFVIDDGAWNGTLAGGTDLRIRVSNGDLEVRFVRVIKLDPP